MTDADSPQARPLTGAAPASPMPASASRTGPARDDRVEQHLQPAPHHQRHARGAGSVGAVRGAHGGRHRQGAVGPRGEGRPGARRCRDRAPTVIRPRRTRSRSATTIRRGCSIGGGGVRRQHDAVTGKSEVLPETGVPDGRPSGDGELTQRRSVDPASGEGEGTTCSTRPATARRWQGRDAPATAATLDAPLASLVDSGAAPPAKPAAPPSSKPAAPATARKPADAGKAMPGVPKRITTDRPAATESGRFRSDARYKRQRGKGCTGRGDSGHRRAAPARSAVHEARRAEARGRGGRGSRAAPPLAAGQVKPRRADTAAAPDDGDRRRRRGRGGRPRQRGHGSAREDRGRPSPEEAPAKTDKGRAGQGRREGRDRQGEKSAKAEKPAGRSDGAEAAPRSARRAATAGLDREARRDRGARRSPPSDEAKAGGEAAKPADTAKTAEAAKPADGDKGEAAKPAEAATAAGARRPPVPQDHVEPGGRRVVIDGVPVGDDAVFQQGRHPDGTHAISVKKDGFEPQERMISGSDWSRGKGGAQSLKFNMKLRRAGGEAEAAPKRARRRKQARSRDPDAVRAVM